MIAADSSSLSAYFKGESGPDVEQVAGALLAGTIAISPVILTEMLSSPSASRAMMETVIDFPLLPIIDGFWQRAGEARSRLRSLGLRAKVGDALIAQSCLDHAVSLITRDADFRHFAAHCGLKLA